MREVVILDPSGGREWFSAKCEGDGCDRTFEGSGTLGSRRAAERAQKHADRSGHRIDAQWANRVPGPDSK